MVSIEELKIMREKVQPTISDHEQRVRELAFRMGITYEEVRRLIDQAKGFFTVAEKEARAKGDSIIKSVGERFDD